MKLKYSVAAAIATLMCAGHANAGLLIDPYIGVTAGVGGTSLMSSHDTTTHFAQNYGAVAGIDIPVIRAEVEYNYLTDTDLTAQLAMGNVYLKMPTPMFQPYIGAGAGVIFDGKFDDHIDLDSTAAYQGMLGLTFNIPVLPFKIDAEARVLYAHDAFAVDNHDIDMLHYGARVKARVVF